MTHVPRLRPALLACLLVCLAAGEAPPAPRSILFGADLAADRPAAARALFREAGFDCVRLTGGGFAWAVPGHTAWAKALAADGVRVYLQLGSHYPPADYFPLKDAWLVDQDGRTGVEDRTAWAIRYDDARWPQLSYAHQGFRERLEQDFAAYLGNFPAGANLAGVILHNEPGLHWLKDRIFDYSAANVAAFRAWLPSQHPDIATLNRRWGSAFADFAAVVPPARPTPAALAAWLDWRRFQVVQIADFLRWEAGFARRIRPDLARTTNLDGPTGNWFALRCADPEAFSRAMDTVGMDVYPSPWTDRAFVPYAADQLHGVAQGRPAHVLECEVFGDRADAWKALDPQQRADLLRSELWTLLGHGVDGVLLWGFSRGDAFSVTDGAWNPRVLACRDLTHQARMLGLGRFRRPAPAVALVVDPDAYLRAAALDPAHLAGGSALDREFHGLHAALAAAGIPCDVVLAAQLPQVAGRYRALILPAAPLIDQALADRLKAYVVDGGALVAVAPFATADRWGARLPTAPGCGLDGLFTAAADGSPSTPRQTGKGFAVLLPGPEGGAYLDGRAPGLPQTLLRLLGQGGIAPALRLTYLGAAPPDAALMTDGTDRLLVIAPQGSRGSATIAIQAARIELPGPMPAAVFAFPPTAAEDGRVRSGPVRLQPTAIRNGCALEVGEIRGALPVLLTQGSAPLLSLDLPAAVTAGAPLSLRVTCHNPSAAPVAGTVALAAAGLAASAPVDIPAWGAATVDLACPAPAATPRLPVGAVLRTAAGATVTAIPVDLAVE